MATRRGALATGTSRSNPGPAAFATTLNSSRASTLEVSVKLVESRNPQQRPRDPRETRRRYVLHKTPSPQRDERQELDVRWRGAAPREGRCATGRQCPWRRVASPGKPRKRSTRRTAVGGAPPPAEMPQGRGGGRGGSSQEGPDGCALGGRLRPRREEQNLFPANLFQRRPRPSPASLAFGQRARGGARKPASFVGGALSYIDDIWKLTKHTHV